MSDTIKKVCQKCEQEFDGIGDGIKICDECLEKQNWDELGVVMEMDGNMWCCHYINFTNMMECPVGFGETQQEAYKDFTNHRLYE